MFVYLIQTNNICIPSSFISQKANTGSFAANSGSNATTSAEGKDDKCIETKCKHFDAGFFSSFSCNTPCGWTQCCSDYVAWFPCFLEILLFTISLLDFFEAIVVVVASDSDNKKRFINV